MSNTTQYTYGVMGASASSSTIAIDLVPAGAPAQVSGGVSRCGPAQVYRSGRIVPCRNVPEVTVITLGEVIVTPAEKSPHPASGAAQPTATAARATRPANPRRRDVRSTSLTRPILGPGGGWGARLTARENNIQNYPERCSAPTRRPRSQRPSGSPHAGRGAHSVAPRPCGEPACPRPGGEPACSRPFRPGEAARPRPAAGPPISERR